MSIDLRRIKDTDTIILRNCRLAALKDSPHAFGTKLSDEQSKPLSSFESDALRLSSSDTTSMFLALYKKEPHGQIGAFINSDRAYICAMWVSPNMRNMNVGTRLVEMASSWLLGCGHNDIYAWVVDNNEVAISFYKKIGFNSTGTKQFLPSDKTLSETLYKLSLYS